jgi:hypothetical protein
MCLLVPGCGFFLDVPLTENGTRGAGIGGTVTTTFLSTLTLSIMGTPWADVTRSIVTSAGTVTTPGFAHGPLSATSSTAQTDGVIRLNAPVPLAFTTGGAPPQTIPLFATLDVRFLPEPRSFLLLAAGAAALVLVGWSRVRG